MGGDPAGGREFQLAQGKSEMSKNRQQPRVPATKLPQVQKKLVKQMPRTGKTKQGRR